MANGDPSCPRCRSTDLRFERSGGCTGYKCGACNKWSYTAELIKQDPKVAKVPKGNE